MNVQEVSYLCAIILKNNEYWKVFRDATLPIPYIILRCAGLDNRMLEAGLQCPTMFITSATTI